MLGGGLPGQAQAMVLLVEIRKRRTVEIGRVEHRVRRLVVIVARRIRLSAPPSVRRVKPECVFLDRAPDAEAVVVHLLGGNPGRHATRAQGVVKVRPLEALVGVAVVGVQAESVPAVLRHDIEVHAGRRRLRRHAARRQCHFLHGGLIDEILLRGAATVVVRRIERHTVPIGEPVEIPAVVAHQIAVGVARGSTNILSSTEIDALIPTVTAAMP